MNTNKHEIFLHGKTGQNLLIAFGGFLGRIFYA